MDTGGDTSPNQRRTRLHTARGQRPHVGRLEALALSGKKLLHYLDLIGRWFCLFSLVIQSNFAEFGWMFFVALERSLLAQVFFDAVSLFVTLLSVGKFCFFIPEKKGKTMRLAVLQADRYSINCLALSLVQKYGTDSAKAEVARWKRCNQTPDSYLAVLKKRSTGLTLHGTQPTEKWVNRSNKLVFERGLEQAWKDDINSNFVLYTPDPDGSTGVFGKMLTHHFGMKHNNREGSMRSRTTLGCRAC